MIPNLLLALALAPAAAQDEAPRASEDEAANVQSAFERFDARGKEFSQEVRAILDQRYAEEREILVKGYENRLASLENDDAQIRDLTIERLENFKRKYPNDDYTPHVMFRLAELYFEEAREDYYLQADSYDEREEAFYAGELEDLPQIPTMDLSNSIALYEEIIERFPSYESVDASYYMLGYSFRDELSKQWNDDPTSAEETSAGYYKALVDAYPNSRYAIDGNLLLGSHYFENATTAAEIEASIPYFERVVAAGPKHESKRYDKGLYQLAWAHYKLSHYELSTQLFTDLLDYSEDLFLESGRRSEMRPEAIRYLAISFSDVGDLQFKEPLEIGKAWFNKIGPQPYEDEVIKDLAEVLIQQARYESAIEVYRYVQSRWPEDPDNPVYQNKIAQLYGQLPVPDYTSSARASAELAEIYDVGTAWWNANRNNPDAQNRARRFIEGSKSAVARSMHEQAIQSGDPADYREAAAKYEDYIAAAPFADDYYEVTYYLADTYLKSLQYEQAIDVYTQLLKFDKHDYRDESLYNRWRAYYAWLSNEYGQVHLRAPDAVVEETIEVPKGSRDLYALSELHARYIEVCDELKDAKFTNSQYAQALDDAEAVLYYHPGQILFEYGRYEQAEERFLKLIDLMPRTNEAAYAAQLIVRSYQEDGDLQKVALYTSKFIPMNLGDASNATAQASNFGTILEQTTFQIAYELAEAKQHVEAAEAFLTFIEDFGESENVKLALYNAANNYEAAGKNDTANQLFEQYINDYPRDEQSKFLYLRIADNYSGILELDKSIDYYERLYRYFPDDTNAQVALYNAGFLRIGRGDFQGAAENFEEYVRRFGDSADAESTYWQAGAQWERVGESEAYAFYNRYLSKFPNENPEHVMETRLWLAEYWERKEDSRKAELAWEDVLLTFDDIASGEKGAGPRARNIAARAAFRKLSADFEAFVDFEATGNEESDVKALTETKPAELEAIISERERLIGTYLDFDYTTAALYIEGAAYLAYAEMLFNYPIPEEWSFEKQEIYRGLLDELAAPVEEKGLNRLISNVDKASAEKRSSEWIDKSILLLNDFRPSEYPLEKPEVRGDVRSVAVPRSGPQSLPEEEASQ